jgi:hypothetical protein
MHDAILDLVRQAHALTESAAVASGDPIARKQFLLADMALHLVQAALRPQQPVPAELKRYLFSVLTVSDAFVPDVDLKAMAEVLLPPLEPQTPPEA